MRKTTVTEEDLFDLVDMKTRGGLIKATNSVIMVCQETEKCFQKIKNVLGGKLPPDFGIDKVICLSVLRNIQVNKFFNDLDTHVMDGSVTDNHVVSLIKTIAVSYSKVRLHHMARESNESIIGKKVRKELSRLVIFKNQ